MKTLVTGGLGFIGTNLIKKLTLSYSHDLHIIDNLNSQVHDSNEINLKTLYDLNIDVHIGDIRNIDEYFHKINDFDVLVHLAAETGTAQSMYEVGRYVDVNLNGTASIIDMIMNGRISPKKIVLASSRSVYGEGSYWCSEHGKVHPKGRLFTDLNNGLWFLRCPFCKQPTSPIPTSEDAPISCASIYAHTKFSQEELLRIACESKGIQFIALRLQNVYGTGQSLKNPYTGILSIFSNRIKQNLNLPLFEDGEMGRDFVNVNDVTDAIILSINYDNTESMIFNIGSGEIFSIKTVSEMLLLNFDSYSEILLTGDYRVGDIRSCYADICKAKNVLNYSPLITLKDGLSDFCDWVKNQPIYEDQLSKASHELKSRDLMK